MGYVREAIHWKKSNNVGCFQWGVKELRIQLCYWIFNRWLPMEMSKCVKDCIEIKYQIYCTQIILSKNYPLGLLQPKHLAALLYSLVPLYLCLNHFVLELSAYPLATLGWLCHYRIPLSKLFYSQISCFIKLCIKVTKNCTENIIDIDFLFLALTFSCSTSFYIYYAKYGSPRCCRMQIQIQIWKGCRKQYSLWQGVIHKVRNYG